MYDWKTTKFWYRQRNRLTTYSTLERGSGLYTSLPTLEGLHVTLMSSPTMRTEIEQAIAKAKGEEYTLPEWYTESDGEIRMEYWKGLPITSIDAIAVKRVRNKHRQNEWLDVKLYVHKDGWGILCHGTKFELDLERVVADYEQYKDRIDSQVPPVNELAGNEQGNDGGSVHAGTDAPAEVPTNGGD